MDIFLTSDLHRGFSRSTVRIHRRFFERMGEEHLRSPARALILAGDLISHRQRQLPGLFKQIRECLPTIPVLLVWGNHDYWDRETPARKMDFESMVRFREKWCQEFGITDLNVSGPRILDDVTFFGFSSWYHNPFISSNDRKHLVYEGIVKPSPLMKWLGDEALRGLDRVLTERLQSTTLSDVLVTHFPPEQEGHMALYARWGKGGASPSFFCPMQEQFDAVLYGHTHLAWNDQVVGSGARFINAGSDYDAPRYVRVSL